MSLSAPSGAGRGWRASQAPLRPGEQAPVHVSHIHSHRHSRAATDPGSLRLGSGLGSRQPQSRVFDRRGIAGLFSVDGDRSVRCYATIFANHRNFAVGDCGTIVADGNGVSDIKLLFQTYTYTGQ